MARPKRERPSVEEAAEAVPNTVVEPDIKLVPQPESLGGGERARVDTAGQEPKAAPATEQVKPQSQPAPTSIKPPLERESVPEEEAEVAELRGKPGATAELDVYQDSSLDVHRGEQSSSSFGGPGGGLHFEAVQIGGSESHLELPTAKASGRTAHLGLRTTPGYLKEHQRKVHLLAAMNGVTVEEVNVFLLNEMAESFQRVDQRIKAHQKKMLDEELEEQARLLRERRRGL